MIVLSIINGGLSVFGSVMNLFVILVIFKNRELQNELNILMASLATADFLVACFIQPTYVAYLNTTEPGTTFRDFLEISTLITGHASFNSLLGITINRMWVLCTPFSNALFIQWRRLGAILAAIWLSSIGMGIFFHTDIGKHTSPYIHAVMFLVFVITYAYIFWIAWKQTKKITSQAQSLSYNHRSTKVKTEKSAARTSALLVGSSMLCYLPDIVYDFLRELDQMRFSWGFTLLYLSSSLNPCIYVWRTQVFRSALISMLSRLPIVRDHVSSSGAGPVERAKPTPAVLTEVKSLQQECTQNLGVEDIP